MSVDPFPRSAPLPSGSGREQTSLARFAVGAAARWGWLWLPLALFPVLATAVILIEVFWME